MITKIKSDGPDFVFVGGDLYIDLNPDFNCKPKKYNFLWWEAHTMEIEAGSEADALDTFKRLANDNALKETMKERFCPAINVLPDNL